MGRASKSNKSGKTRGVRKEPPYLESHMVEMSTQFTPYLLQYYVASMLLGLMGFMEFLKL